MVECVTAGGRVLMVVDGGVEEVLVAIAMQAPLIPWGEWRAWQVKDARVKFPRRPKEDHG